MGLRDRVKERDGGLSNGKAGQAEPSKDTPSPKPAADAQAGREVVDEGFLVGQHLIQADRQHARIEHDGQRVARQQARAQQVQPGAVEEAETDVGEHLVEQGLGRGAPGTQQVTRIQEHEGVGRGEAQAVGPDHGPGVVEHELWPQRAAEAVVER